MRWTLFGGIQHCKRCAAEYSGKTRSCPHCAYNPKQRGIRVAMFCFFVVVLAMTGAQVALAVYPPVSGYLVAIAGVGFILTLLILVLAFVATPNRLGRLFVRP